MGIAKLLKLNTTKNWAKLALLSFFLLPALSIIIKLIVNAEMDYVILDIIYLGMILFCCVVAWLGCAIAARAKSSSNVMTTKPNKLAVILIAVSIATFVWGMQAVSGGRTFGVVINDFVFRGLFYYPTVASSLVYGILLGVVAVELVVANIVVVSKIKPQPHRIYKLSKTLYVGSAIVSIVFVIVALAIKALLQDEDYWFGEAYFLAFYLVYYPVFYFFSRRMHYSHQVSLVNALWFVPIINICFSLVLSIPTNNFWINNFSWILLGVGNSVVFGAYYVRRRYRKRAYLLSANQPLIVNLISKKAYLLLGVFCALSYVTVVGALIFKLYVGVSFMPYVVADLAFVVVVLLGYVIIVVCYYFRYAVGLSKLVIRAFGVMPYFVAIVALLMILFFVDSNEDTTGSNFWHLHFVYIVIIIVNIVALVWHYLCRRHFNRRLRGMDIFE